MGTVGAVAVDADGNIACATSTGGMLNKMEGRVGDTACIGQFILMHLLVDMPEQSILRQKCLTIDIVTQTKQSFFLVVNNLCMCVRMWGLC